MGNGIFGMSEPIEVLTESRTIVLGELTHDESEALQAMLMMGSSMSGATSRPMVKQEVEVKETTSAETEAPSTSAELLVPSTSTETPSLSTDVTAVDVNTKAPEPSDDPLATITIPETTDSRKRPSQFAMQSPPPKRLTRSLVKNVSTKLTDECIIDILNNQPKVLI